LRSQAVKASSSAKANAARAISAHCALPIELQGSGLAKKLPAKQWAMGNGQWAMLDLNFNGVDE